MTTTPADPPLPFFTATIQRGPIEARPAIVYVIGDGEHAQLMTLAHLSQLLAALPEETQEALLGPFLADVEPVMTELATMTAERDALAAKLGKAMAVVEAALRWFDDEENDYVETLALNMGLIDAIEKHGFIDRDGHRLDAAGKDGA